MGILNFWQNCLFERLNKINPANPKNMSKPFINKIKEYNWPGNVRELQNVMERAYYLAEGSIITKEYLPENMSISDNPKNGKMILCP
ncbi:MAG: hypothetical protein QME46_11740 [Thermoanaerobacteraceae bacterium]|nr:hypothetical protein [Thermoanaerobacteraceae bacterium]